MTTTVAAVERAAVEQRAEEVAAAGYKFVTADYRPPLMRDGNRYTPGTTQWIKWPHWIPHGAVSRLPDPVPCTEFALHYCKYALQALRFVNGFESGNLRLLRVTPQRWPGAAPHTPLFLDSDDGHDPKRGAHGLRVDAEIVDAAELRALLSGVLRRRNTHRLWSTDAVVDAGRVISHTVTDALGNVVARKHASDDAANLVGRYILMDPPSTSLAAECLMANRIRLPLRLENKVDDGHVVVDGMQVAGERFLCLDGVVARLAAARDTTTVEISPTVVFVVTPLSCDWGLGVWQTAAQYTVADVEAAVKRFRDESAAAGARCDEEELLETMAV